MTTAGVWVAIFAAAHRRVQASSSGVPAGRESGRGLGVMWLRQRGWRRLVDVAVGVRNSRQPRCWRSGMAPRRQRNSKGGGWLRHRLQGWNPAAATRINNRGPFLPSKSGFRMLRGWPWLEEEGALAQLFALPADALLCTLTLRHSPSSLPPLSLLDHSSTTHEFDALLRQLHSFCHFSPPLRTYPHLTLTHDSISALSHLARLTSPASLLTCRASNKVPR